MALKEGKQTVKLKASVADNIGVPKFPTTNIAAEIAKPISESIDAFRKVAEADAAVSFKTDFNTKARDHYIELQKKFEFDPDGMKNAVDSYSKTTLANAPLVYRDYASNILAQKNLANVGYATKNFKARNDQLALEKFSTSRNDFENDFVFNLDNIVEDTNTNVRNINTHTANTHFLNQNEVYGSAGEALVATNRYSGIKLNKNLDEDLEMTEVLRVFSIMKKVGKNKALTYIGKYAQGNDEARITVDDFEDIKKLNNPVFKKYEAYIRNPLNREKIVKQVIDLYDDYNGKTIKDLQSAKSTFSLEGEQEPGGSLHISNFSNGKITNAVDYVSSLPIKSTQYNDAIEIVQSGIDIQTKVVEAKNNKKVDFVNDDERELFTKAILADNGITNMNLTDVTNPALAEAVDQLKKQNIVPEPILKKLNTKINSDFNNPGMVTEFRKNLSLYNYMKAQYKNLDVENSFIYDEANLLIAEGVTDDAVLGSRLNTLAGDAKNYTGNKEKITTNLAENASTTTELYADIISEMDINTGTNFIRKFFLDKKLKYTDLFETSGTTYLYKRPKTLLMGDVKAEWLKHTTAVLTHLNGGKEFNIDSKEGKALFRKAANISMERLDKAGYGASNFTYSGNTTIMKHPYEKYGKVDGQALENSIMAIARDLDANLSDQEKREKFGLKETSTMPLIGRTELEANNIVDIVKTSIDENMKGIVIEPTGTMDEGGNPQYHLKINHGGYTINLTEGTKYFDPTGFDGQYTLNKGHANRNQLILQLANEKYQMFDQTFGHLIEGKGYENLARSVIYKTIKMGIEASDYKFYPDIPLLNDVPEEVRPFAFIFKAMGIDVDLRPYYDDAAKINREINKHLSYDQQIIENKKLSTVDKEMESGFPPHETKYTRSNLSLQFKNWAYNNYNNKDLPLTFRTNNYMAVMKTDSAWNGQITDIDTGNQAAIFSSPVDSIRAGVRVMINNSTLINNNTTKRYSDTPSIGEILSVYAKDSTSYLNALESKTSMTRDDEVNFYDSQQMFQLIKFMIEHEMGSEAFSQYYGPGKDGFLNAMILEGYTQGINSYGGKLGKIR